MLRTEDRPTAVRESKHIHAPVSPSKLLAEITNCSSCLSRRRCWSPLGVGQSHGAASSASVICAPWEMGHLGVRSGPAWDIPKQSALCQHVPIGFTLGNFPKEEGTSFILLIYRGPSPIPLCSLCSGEIHQKENGDFSQNRM